MSEALRRCTGSARALLAAVIVLSVAARLASAFYHGPRVQPLPGVTDQISYHELAKRVLDGHGFSFASNWWPATRANHPTAHWSFLYVLFLAGVYGVFGPAPLAARLIQALVVGVLQPWLAWRIGRRVANPAVGLAAAALTAFYGYFVFYAGALVTESFYFVAVLWVLDGAIVIAATPPNGQRFKPWLALGLAFAAAVLLRQAFLLMIPVIGAWILWRQVRHPASPKRRVLLALAVRSVAAAGILVAAIAPWTVRNYRAFNEFVLLNTNAGFVFYWANHPAHGSTFIPIIGGGTINYRTMLPWELRRLNEAQLDKALMVRGVGFVREDPWRYTRLSASRAREYFKFWPSSDSGLASNAVRVLSFGLLLPLIVAGIALVAVRRGTVSAGVGTGLLLLVAAAYSAIHILTWTLVRYRLPVDAMLMPVAAIAVVALFRWTAVPRRRAANHSAMRPAELARHPDPRLQ